MYNGSLSLKYLTWAADFSANLPDLVLLAGEKARRLPNGSERVGIWDSISGCEGWYQAWILLLLLLILIGGKKKNLRDQKNEKEKENI